MNDDIVIDVKNISKKYTIATDYQPDTLREKIVELAKYPLKVLKGEHQKPKTKEYWALKDVSFQVKRGEVLGIIGKNGAGKSTLLKILSRTTEPTSGTIQMKGKVASLLEVGTGFNPELTGRENIYLNGAIIGMSKKEINSKFNEIVEFAGIGEFLDTPVKRYSSGMYVRLAFAVAAHLDSDILILDEVLAVGDAEFHKKSYKKVKDLVYSGKTIVIVSHQMSAVRELASSVIVIEKGKLINNGETNLVIHKYLNTKDNNDNLITRFTRNDTQKKLLLKSISIEASNPNSKDIKYGDTLQITVRTNKIKSPVFAIEIIIKNDMMEKICYLTTMTTMGYEYIASGSKVELLTEPLNLAEGRYWIDVNCRQYPNIHVDRWNDAGYFDIKQAIVGNATHSTRTIESLGSWIIKSKTTL